MSGPKIRAAFVTDLQHRPYASDDGHHTHYRIVLSLEGAPEGTQSVTYKLHETYADALREVGQGPSFQVEITSYGDFAIKALVRTANDFEILTSSLIDALRGSYGANPDPEIASAIDVLATP